MGTEPLSMKSNTVSRYIVTELSQITPDWFPLQNYLLIYWGVCVWHVNVISNFGIRSDVCCECTVGEMNLKMRGFILFCFLLSSYPDKVYLKRI